MFWRLLCDTQIKRSFYLIENTTLIEKWKDVGNFSFRWDSKPTSSIVKSMHTPALHSLSYTAYTGFRMSLTNIFQYSSLGNRKLLLKVCCYAHHYRQLLWAVSWRKTIWHNMTISCWTKMILFKLFYIYIYMYNTAFLQCKRTIPNFIKILKHYDNNGRVLNLLPVDYFIHIV